MKVISKFLDWVIFKIPENGTNQRLHTSTTWFDMLYAESGYNNAKNWFMANASSPGNTFNESQFSQFMSRLTDFDEYDSLDIFDLFDKDETGYIGFDEFFLIISLLSARESGQCTKFLYKHGRSVFDLLSTTPSTTSAGPGTSHALITFEAFARFGFILGMSEIEIMAMLGPSFEVTVFDMMDIERFLLYYFYILDAYDKRKNAITEDMHATPYMPALSTVSTDLSSKIEDEQQRRDCCCIIV